MVKTRRAVVTGMGLVTPLGVGLTENWEAVCAGRSGTRRIDRFDVSDLDSQVAGLVVGFDPGRFLRKKDVRKTDPFLQYTLAATRLAMEDAGFVVDEANAERVGVVIGSGMGGLQTIERAHKILQDQGPGRISPFFLPMAISNLAPGRVAIEWGARGPNLCVVTACSTGTHCIGQALRLIRHDHADAVIAGGAEASVTRLSLAGFSAMRALSRRNDSPETACRPFDLERDGFVMGEGAGVLIVEEGERARRRGARIYGEIAGYGESGDAYHIVAPPPDGEGAARCMRLALEDARISAEDVDYVNAHGSGTPQNDTAETEAIKRAFGRHAYRLAVSSTKSMTGHLLGATGSVEAIYTVMALHDGIVPPTINYGTPDPACDLDYVPNTARPQAMQVAMSNSFGFGGTNATLVFRREAGTPAAAQGGGEG